MPTTTTTHPPGHTWKEWVQSIFAVVIALEMFFVFDSLFMCLLTLTFFFYIPTVSEEGGANKWIFLAGMIIILGMAFIDATSLGLGLEMGAEWYKPWNWNTPTIIFFGIWLIGFITGLEAGNDIESRQAIGLILFISSFVIFSMGVGTQEVGQAFFGPWWPTVYTTAADVFEPLSESWYHMQQTLGVGWQLITDPYGYAQGMISGTYTQDPITGLAGAYGVEIEDFSTTPIFIEQPFVLTMQISNKGAFEAKRVRASIYSATKAAREEFGVNIPYPELHGQIFLDSEFGELWVPFGVGSRIKVTEYGFDDANNEYITCTLGVCSGGVLDEEPGVGKQVFNLARVDTMQLFFRSDKGINCKTINDYELTDKFLPIIGQIMYDYEIDATTDIEFMSKDEWNRKVADGSLEKQKKKSSKLTNAPVRLNIDTLEQPVREGTPFFIGFALESAQESSSAIINATVMIEYPEDFILSGAKCSTDPTDYNSNILVWKNLDTRFPVYCYFSGYRGMEDPSETFIIKGHADYTFVKWKEESFKIEFGGVDCGSGTGTGPIVPSECESIPDTYFSGYLKHYATIQAAVQKYNLGSYVDHPEELVAAIITAESRWDEDAVSPCAAAGLMQMVPGTARGRGLNVPVYQQIDATVSCPACADLLREAGLNPNTQISVCNSCTENQCDKTNDERFDAAKTIDAGVNYLVEGFQDPDCQNNLARVIGRYNSGDCSGASNPGYTQKVLTWHETWKECFERKGEEDYCSDKIERGWGKCEHGEGDCDEFPADECDTSISHPTYGALDCKTINGVDVDVCCYTNEPDEDCKQAYEYWILH